jgi:hypothetical protein
MKISDLVYKLRWLSAPLVATLARLAVPVYAVCFTQGTSSLVGLIQTWGGIALALVYAVILLGWVTGILMWSAPTRSVVIKRSGQQQAEISAIALFVVLIGPAIFLVLIPALAGVANANGYCTPS